MLQRRRLITGIAGLLVTPAIVRAASLMPVKVHPLDYWAPYGRSPAMDMLANIQEINARVQAQFYAAGGYGERLFLLPTGGIGRELIPLSSVYRSQ